MKEYCLDTHATLQVRSSITEIRICSKCQQYWLSAKGSVLSVFLGEFAYSRPRLHGSLVGNWSLSDRPNELLDTTGSYLKYNVNLFVTYEEFLWYLCRDFSEHIEKTIMAIFFMVLSDVKQNSKSWTCYCRHHCHYLHHHTTTSQQNHHCCCYTLPVYNLQPIHLV